jgi:hypothetical protein
MPLEIHPDLILPPDKTVLWRYMDIRKFLLLLEYRSLWFPRGDQFEDPLEGCYTDVEVEDLRSLDTTAGPKFSDSALQSTEFMRTTSYVSCWRAGENESMAMWDLYGKGGGLAVKTTAGHLKEAIAESRLRIFLGWVEYVDMGLSSLRDRGPMAMFFRKDQSYEHEKEVRAVIWDQSLISKNADDALIAARLRTDYPSWGSNPFVLRKGDGERGINVEFSADRFITEVVVGPREEPLFARLVESILSRYKLPIKLTPSIRLKPR